MPDPRVFLCYGIFESFFLIYLGISLFGLKMTRTKLLVSGFSYAGLALIIRWVQGLFSIPFGIHTILNMLALMIIFRLLNGEKWSVALGASLSSFVFIFIGEILVYIPFGGVADPKNDLLLHLIQAYFGLLPGVLTVILLKYNNINLFIMGRGNTQMEGLDNLENKEDE